MNFRPAIVAVVAVLGLAGCVQVSAVKTAMSEEGARAADESLRTALWALCKPQTTGAWVREFGNDPARAEAWRVLCGYRATPAFAAPPAERAAP